MRSLVPPCSAALLLACGGPPAHAIDDEPEPLDLLAHVDPRIATGGVGFSVGSAYPGPALPFAMIHPGPDTGTHNGAPFYHCSGYYWDDDRIRAFSLLRMHGTGVPDYGVFGVMPVPGWSNDRLGTEPEPWSDRYSHDEEVAEVGYYRVRTARGVTTELTSTLRAGALRFTFEDASAPAVVLNLDHALGGGRSLDQELSVDADGGFRGNLLMQGDLSDRFGGYRVFVEGRFEPMPASVTFWNGSTTSAGPGALAGDPVVGVLGFPAGTAEVRLRVAVSFVDQEGARRNLEAELPRFDFAATRQAARDAWRPVFDAHRTFQLDEREATITATALYHAFLMPTLMSDVDGRFLRTDGSVTSGTRPHYSDFSLWDTYRTLHPWVLLMEAEAGRDFARSLVEMGESCGNVPRWSLANGDAKSMVGTPGEIVLAESALKGQLDEEERAWAIARKSAFEAGTGPCGGRERFEQYRTLGYVPGEVSVTQEIAIADAALAAWAERRGAAADLAVLRRQADSWKNLWDPGTGFFRARDESGAFLPFPGALTTGGPYVEGNAWQYLWLAPSDLQGLQTVLGGREAALARLDEFFENSVDEVPVLNARRWYWHGNEPDLHAAWIYAAWGDRTRAARWLRWVGDTMYGTGPDGLAGNDDGGTLSAWWLFATTGLYPIAGTDRYLVAAPRHRRTELVRPSGKLVVRASHDPATHPVVVRVLLDGAPLEGPELRHAALEGDRELFFELAAE